jgi:4-hydroxybenzoate polyprenyltransferase
LPWLRLIRWKNLLIIFLTQLLAWWFVIMPESPEILTPFNFFCIALSTVLIAAAGYIINDYFDIKIDLINRPQKVVLEKKIPRKQAIISHTVLNFIALLLAAWVAAQAHHYEWLLLQMACTLLLWFYSTDLKRQYITGNIAISILTALTILVLVLYEPRIYLPRTKPQPGYILSAPGWVLGIYAYFAFMLTWMREIVKDMEDHIGDAAEGCVTMPVKKGLKYSANFTIMLGVLVVIPLAVAAYKTYTYRLLPFSGYLAMLMLTIVSWSVFLHRRPATVQHYASASRGLKIIMLLGVLSLIIYHFQIFARP